MVGVGIAIVSGGGSLRESSPRLHASRHPPQFLRDPAHPQIPARGLGYRIEVVRHGYKISDQIVMTDGRKVLAATSSVLWKLDYVIRAIRHVCFSKLSKVIPCGVQHIAKETVKCLSQKMTELFRRAFPALEVNV